MLINAVFMTVLVICFVTDVREQKIYNKIVLPSTLMVLILNSWMYGFDGFKLSLFGFIAGLAILLIPYLFGGMGAGDVKLLAFIGAAKGVTFVVNSALYMAIVGGVVALAILVFNKQAASFIKNVFSWIISLFYKVRREIDFSNNVGKNKFPYGTAIVTGALICHFFKGAWLI